jgi:hypothetical protein
MRKIEVAANYYDLQVAPSFSAYLSSTTTIPNATYTKVIFDTVEWDNTGAYDSTTGDWTPAKGAHRVLFTICGFNRSRTTSSTTAANAFTKKVHVFLFKNGDSWLRGAVPGISNFRNINNSSYPYGQNKVFHRTAHLSAIIDANGTDTYAVYVGITSAYYTLENRLWGQGNISSDFSNTSGANTSSCLIGNESSSGTNRTDRTIRNYFQAYMIQPSG